MSDSAPSQVNAPAKDRMFVKAFLPGVILGLVIGAMGSAFLIPFLSEGGVPPKVTSVPPAPNTNPATPRDRDARPNTVTPKPAETVDPKKPAPATTPATTPPAPK